MNETTKTIKDVEETIDNIDSLETRKILMDIAADKNVKINGLERVPFIVRGCPAVSFHKNDQAFLKALGLDPDDLFEGQGFFNTAIFPATEKHGIKVEPLRVVSDQYKLVQHDEMVLKILQAIPKQVGVHTVDINTSLDGGRCYARFQTNKSAEIIPGDIIEFRIGAANSVDATSLFKLRQEAFRQWCSNGAMAPDSRFEKINSRRLHKNGLELDNEIGRFVASLDQVQEVMNGWKQYAKTPLTAPDLDGLFEQLETGPKVQDELMDTELRGDEVTPRTLLENKNLTAWNMYNAWTQRITDSKSEETVKVENGLKVSEAFERIVNAA